MTEKLQAAACILLASHLAAQHPPSWTELSSNGPWLREHHAMVFDSHRARTVVFGGRHPTTSSLLSDAWEWDGGSWSRLPPGPPARYQHAMAFDSQRGVTVLFGGNGSSGPLGDTWEFDGTAWTQVSATGPANRSSHAMAYDAPRGRVLLFGGQGSTGALLGDTWDWDGVAWSRVTGTSPPARADHAMARAPLRGRIVMYGGRGASSLLDDTWEWTGAGWQPQLFAVGPPARKGHVMLTGLQSDRVVSLWGDGVSDAWEWDGVTWSLTSLLGVTPRSSHAAALDASRSRYVLIGGNGGTTRERQQTWEWDASRWLERLPPLREGHAMVYDTIRDRTVMFGGRDAQGYFNDTWELVDREWTKVADGGPSARSGHAMAFDSQRGRTVLFGAGAPALAVDTWEWDGMQWARQNIAAPPIAVPAKATYDEVRAAVLLTSIRPGTSYNATWERGSGAWTLIENTSLPRRHAFGLTFDTRRGRAFVFGGDVSIGGLLNDTLEWDGAGWVQLATAGPSARRQHAIAYNSAQSRVVLFGGYTVAGASGDTWEWDGAVWSIMDAGPSPRFGHAMIYDRRSQRVVMFGGWDGSEYQDGTWEWLSGWQGTGQTFGAGCGTPPLDLAQDPAGRPVLGQTARAFVSNATSVFTFVVFGWSDSVFGSFTLPLPLDGFGLPGCTLLQSAESGSLSVTLAGPTAATFELPIPNVGGLLGLDLSLQAWSNAPGANPGNTIVSNGLRWEVGSR